MGAGMDEFVQNDQIALLRQGREHRKIGDITAAEEQRALGTEETSRFGFERLVLGVVASREPVAPTGVPAASAAARASAIRLERARPR